MIFTAPESILIRPATSADARAIERLAQLDSSPVPTGELLVAEVGGELRAALRVDGHAVIADPFRPTAGIVDLLAARAEHLQGPRRHRAVRREHLRHRAGGLHPSV
jgi:hypothetical protein